MTLEESLALQHSGKLYIADTPEVAKVQQGCLDRLYDYNHTRPTEPEKRAALLKEMFAEIGEEFFCPHIDAALEKAATLAKVSETETANA